MTTQRLTAAVTDLENQPSQYGTVTLDYHLEKIKQWEDRFERAINIRTTPQPAPTVQGEVVAYLRFWAAQQVSPDGGVEADEGYEVCKKNDIGADGYLAFPVYATPQLGIAQPKQDNYDSLINSVKMQSAAQAGLVAGQEYDSVTRESAENAIEYMSSYNGRGREVDAQAMLVTTPPPPSIGGEVTDAEVTVDAQGVNFGKWCWVSHEKITSQNAETLSSGGSGPIARGYMKWLNARLAATTPQPVEDYPHTPFVDDKGMIEAGDLDGAQPAIAATTKPADSAAVQAEPVAYSITTNGEHTGNFFTDEQDTRIVMKRLNDRYPRDVRKIEPLFTTPQTPTAQPVAPGWQLVPVELKSTVREVLVNRFDRARQGECMLFNDIWAELLFAAPSMPPKEGV